MKKLNTPLLIGAHTSIANGIHHALLEGTEIGATTIQIFTANQRRWASPPISDKNMALWFETLEKSSISSIMSHASYLINLASPNPETLQKSQTLFRVELERCLKLGVKFLNFHPGASLDAPKEEAIHRICNSLLQVQDLVSQEKTLLLLEATAGQGSSIGHTFEELRAIIEQVKGVIPIGVCIDTCHIFAAGYDLRSPDAIDHTLQQFDKIVGLEYLKAFHLNDSKGKLGSKKDRHESLGKGEIGMECFKYLMQNPKTKYIPKYLETPDPSLWKEEIATLRTFGNMSLSDS